MAASAQETPRAQLTGSIRDSSGAVIERATVSAQNEETGVRRTVESSDTGEFFIASLPPGPYKVTVRKPGFQTIARLNFSLAEGASHALDFTMRIGSVREVITITDDPPLINREDGSAGTSVRRGLIDEIPLNGRGLHRLVDLASGVIATPATMGEAGQFTANGQRPNTNYFSVDGVSANTGVGGGGMPAQFWGGTLPAMTAFGSTHNLVSLAEAEEVRVQTSSFAPEFGRMPGAQIAITTRSGANRMHGAMFYSMRHEALAARDWFSNAYALGDAPLRFHHSGASLGGPLRRNSTFFHASWEALRMTQPATWRSVVPSLETRQRAPEQYRALLDAFPLPTGSSTGSDRAFFTARISRPARLDWGALRIDHALSPRMTLFGRYTQAPSSSESGFAQIEEAQFRYRSLTLGLTALHSAAWSSEVRLNSSSASAKSSWRFTGLGSARPLDLTAILPRAQPGYSAVHGIAIAGLGELVNGEGGRNRQGQWNLTGTIAWNGATHAARFGFDYLRLTPERSNAAQAVAGSFASFAQLLNGEAPIIADARADQASSLIETLSLFFQDTWRPAALQGRLSLTYGSRWEITPPPSVRQSSTGSGVIFPGDTLPSNSFPLASSGALWPTRYDQIAPRIGAAYKLTDKTVVRAGWGLFYDLGFSAATDPINGLPFNRWQFLFPSTGIAVTPPGGETMSGRGFARDLRLPYAHHWNAAAERTIGGSAVVSISFVGAAGRNLLRREAARKPGTRVADVIVATNDGVSGYRALQLQYRRRLARGLQGMVSYTWSHSIDNASWDSAVALAETGFDAGNDRASSSFDARQAFAAALSYDSSELRGAPKFLRGWRAGASSRARTGFPIDLLTTPNLLGLGFDNITRPDVVGGVPHWVADAGAPGGRRLNAAAFRTPTGLQGSLGRNTIRGLGMWQIDLSLSRSFRACERATLDLRIDAFNALNRASFADPVRFLDHPLFGTPASMLNLMLGSGSPRSGLAPALQNGAPRTIQATLRLVF